MIIIVVLIVVLVFVFVFVFFDWIVNWVYVEEGKSFMLCYKGLFVFGL